MSGLDKDKVEGFFDRMSDKVEEVPKKRLISQKSTNLTKKPGLSERA